ncbi:MAG: hypothetical protein ACRD7E_18315 [Bryobacteraceae bacterium]
MRRLRVAAGVLVLCLLVLMAVLLTPPYVENWRLQQYIDALIQQPQTHTSPPDLVRVRVMQKAEELGIPLKSGSVSVTPREDRLAIEAKYPVRVDFLIYTVDLHFRASAGAN